MKNTYLHIPRDDEKDRIEVEVGDSKVDTFIPQVKLMRFDNECNLSIRYKHDGKGKETHDWKDGKCIWKKGKAECHIYDIENGYEIEAILNEKPQSNAVEFTLESKGIDFFFQPELTEDEKSNGYHRPENVVGSYAVYMTGKKKTYVKGKQYRTGKIGHIFRPRIIDVKGEWVWGKLNIEKKLLTVTVPQEFLDRATYPVVVDPTIGYDEIGASNVDFGSADGAFCSHYNTVLAADGDVVTQYHFYAKKEADNETVALNMYRIESDEPTTKLGVADQSVNVNSTTAQWWNSSVVSQSLTAGNEYGVAYGGWGGTVPDENTQIYFDTLSGRQSTENSATSLSSTWSLAASYTAALSLYASLTREPIALNYTYTIFIDKANP